ncbi:hypothetical protein [Microbacterium sp. YY-01]|uniref:hypothetical protein n=1 Tax=Microbacterium sp. YY-01 TaxID=3421634 RepID=UPI003D164D69
MTDTTPPSGDEPRAVWVFPPERPRRGRTVVITILVLVAVAVAVGVLLFFVNRPDATPQPAPTTPSASPTATPTSLPSVLPSPTETVVQSPTPTPTKPPVDDAVEGFAAQIEPRLNDARTGLDIVADESDSSLALEVVRDLQNDVQVMSEMEPPVSISKGWHSGLADYRSALSTLREVLADGGNRASALSAARVALDNMFDVIGR